MLSAAKHDMTGRVLRYCKETQYRFHISNAVTLSAAKRPDSNAVTLSAAKRPDHDMGLPGRFASLSVTCLTAFLLR